MRVSVGVLLGAGLLLGIEIGAPVGATAQSAAVVSGVVGETGSPSAGVATVTYRFERTGLSVPRFRIAVREDGTGSYQAEEIVGGGGATVGTAPPAPLSHVERAIAITPASTAKIFKVARAERYFQAACASKAKNIADTGAKTLSYEGPDGRGSCSYNYTEDKNVVMLTDLFLGMGTTLDEGRKIEFKRRYDRLGLDAELDVLTQANDAGRAVELGMIAPLLRQLVDDTEMMQRVRLRAAKLLDRAGDGR